MDAPDADFPLPHGPEDVADKFPPCCTKFPATPDSVIVILPPDSGFVARGFPAGRDRALRAFAARVAYGASRSAPEWIAPAGDSASPEPRKRSGTPLEERTVVAAERVRPIALDVDHADDFSGEEDRDDDLGARRRVGRQVAGIR
jgi:hypothetical protein